MCINALISVNNCQTCIILSYFFVFYFVINYLINHIMRCCDSKYTNHRHISSKAVIAVEFEAGSRLVFGNSHHGILTDSGEKTLMILNFFQHVWGKRNLYEEWLEVYSAIYLHELTLSHKPVFLKSEFCHRLRQR